MLQEIAIASRARLHIGVYEVTILEDRSVSIRRWEDRYTDLPALVHMEQGDITQLLTTLQPLTV